MRHLAVAMRGLVIATALAALAAPAVLAGGWATFVPDAASLEGFEPGVPHDVTLTLLQHGKTPLDSGSVTLAFAAPGQPTVDATARSLGGGRWVASVTLPAAGAWALTARHSDLTIDDASIYDVTVSAGSATTAGPGLGVAPIAALVTVLLLAVLLGALGITRLARSPSGTTA